MQKLTKQCIAILLSFAFIFGGVAPSSVPASNAAPKMEYVEVTYQDLRTDEQKQVDCLADNIYFEARQEPVKGQMAVAFVTLNRVQSGKFPETICGVVKQKQRGVCQFSWWCDVTAKTQALRRSFGERDVYEQIRLLATYIFLNHHKLDDVTHGAMFYHAKHVSREALGMRNLRPTARIGQHIFYRNSI